MIHLSLLEGAASNLIGNGTVDTDFWGLLSLVSCPEWAIATLHDRGVLSI